MSEEKKPTIFNLFLSERERMDIWESGFITGWASATFVWIFIGAFVLVYYHYFLHGGFCVP